MKDHPFTPLLRTIARGASLSRALDEAEAEMAMQLILSEAVEPEQLGAFLVLLRYRKETPPELAGFVRAARDFTGCVPVGLAQIDWPSYADRHAQLPYFPLAALLLAQRGIKVAMHGIAGKGPATTRRTLTALGVPLAGSLAEGCAALQRDNFAYFPLELLNPRLARLFDLRPILGVRTLANTVGRALNPLAAPFQLQGVFHPTYLPVHQETARLLHQPAAAIFKGGGGEVQRNPEKACRVAMVANARVYEEEWPAIRPSTRHRWREEPLEPDAVVSLWRGTREAPAPENAIIGTVALALKLVGRVGGQSEAQQLAETMWRDRQRGPQSNSLTKKASS